MTGSKSSNDNNETTKTKLEEDEGGEDSEDESEILEESPCGRWVKRKEKVEQRDVPGIDCAYLAMDTEEGVEVVWNEVLFSERKNFKAQEEKIKQVFDNLTQLEHLNIVKFHYYWMDQNQAEKPRVVFITEYMSSGSLKAFLKITKRNVKRLPLQAWKRWCTQILSALSYLHSCSPSIIHGNLTCDTIFIQHNGLVKIGSVAPDAIHLNVKSCRENIKNRHFIAPEYGSLESGKLTPAVDIYSFGMCALEMAALEIQGNGDSGTVVTEDHINRTIESLEAEELSPLQDFISKCLQAEPGLRPNARELLFHPILFEVPSLKLLSAHALVKNTETFTDEVLNRHYGPSVVIAEINYQTESESASESVQYKMSDVVSDEKLEKFVEDVKFGIYPLTCFDIDLPALPQRQTCSSPEVVDDSTVKSTSPEPLEMENRKIINMMCNVKQREDGPGLIMTILVRMEDKMNRQLSCVVSETDSALELSCELVFFGFINEADRDKLMHLIEESFHDRENNGHEKEFHGTNGNGDSPTSTAPFITDSCPNNTTHSLTNSPSTNSLNS